MKLVLTPTVFLEVFTLCLTWEWEEAVRKYGEEEELWHQDPFALSKVTSPIQRGFATVDKVLRILTGLDLITETQRKLLYLHRPTQRLVGLHTVNVTSGDSISEVRRKTDKQLLLRFDPVKGINSRRMLRDMHFFVSEAGRRKAEAMVNLYEFHLTKGIYLAEIARQKALVPNGSRKKAAVMKRYRAKVESETS